MKPVSVACIISIATHSLSLTLHAVPGPQEYLALDASGRAHAFGEAFGAYKGSVKSGGTEAAQVSALEGVFYAVRNDHALSIAALSKNDRNLAQEAEKRYTIVDNQMKKRLILMRGESTTKDAMAMRLCMALKQFPGMVQRALAAEDSTAINAEVTDLIEAHRFAPEPVSGLQSYMPRMARGTTLRQANTTLHTLLLETLRNFQATLAAQKTAGAAASE